MKAFKKLAAAAAAITFLLSLSILTADAAEAPKGYSYQVTLHAGNQGTGTSNSTRHFHYWL